MLCWALDLLLVFAWGICPGRRVRAIPEAASPRDAGWERRVPLCPSLQKGQPSYFPLEKLLAKTSLHLHWKRCLQEEKGLFVKYVYTWKFAHELSKRFPSAADWGGHLHDCHLEVRLGLAAVKGPGECSALSSPEPNPGGTV